MGKFAKVVMAIMFNAFMGITVGIAMGFAPIRCTGSHRTVLGIWWLHARGRDDGRRVERSVDGRTR